MKQLARRSQIERDPEQPDEEKAEADHERKLQNSGETAGHGAPGGLRDLGVGSVRHIGTDLLDRHA